MPPLQESSDVVRESVEEWQLLGEGAGRQDGDQVPLFLEVFLDIRETVLRQQSHLRQSYDVIICLEQDIPL